MTMVPGSRGPLNKVFEKGESDPENVGGSGLGLTIVRTFVEAHGGTITVESKMGFGSTFRFTLPSKSGASASGSRTGSLPLTRQASTGVLPPYSIVRDAIL